MLLSFLTGALASLTLAQGTDTTVTVQRGARLDVDNHAGEVVVRTWNRDAVRVQADHRDRDRVEIRVSPREVHVEPQGRHGGPRMVDLAITIPSWMAVSVSGVFTDVSMEGVRAAVTVETVHGSVRVRGGSEFVSLTSVEGEVRLDGAKGRIRLNTVNESIHASDLEGELVLETVNGDVVLERARSASVDVSTVNGDVWFDGTIRPGGQYTLATHNGDVTVVVPEGTNAAVAIDTFNGEFESAFPVQLSETRRNRFRFTLGAGGARLDLQSFQGEIRLARPGARPGDDGDYEYRYEGEGKGKSRHHDTDEE